MGSSRTVQYERPAVLASFATDELISDAAGRFSVACGPTPSDEALKREIRTITQPLDRLKTVGAETKERHGN